MAPSVTQASIRKDALSQLLKDILDVDDNNPLSKAIDSNGIKSVQDIILLLEEEINKMTYKDSNSTEALPSMPRSQQDIKNRSCSIQIQSLEEEIIRRNIHHICQNVGKCCLLCCLG